MSNLFYSGSGRHTSGAFTVTMKDGAKLAKQIAKLENGGKAAIQRTGERRADGNQENRQRLYEPCACVGIEGNPPALRS